MMTDRMESAGALQTAYEQLAHLHRMLDGARVEPQDNPSARTVETIQIRRLMEDIQAEMDHDLQGAHVTVAPLSAMVQP